jgi:hypothetical protein
MPLFQDFLYTTIMKVSPEQILPSQNFLKPGTVQFILRCLNTGKTEELPPPPLVVEDENGRMIAVDGHNMIAVSRYRGELVKVSIAKSATDGLPPTSAANDTRNQELADKYDTVLDEQRRVAAEGITSFDSLLSQYPELFPTPPPA